MITRTKLIELIGADKAISYISGNDIINVTILAVGEETVYIRLGDKEILWQIERAIRRLSEKAHEDAVFTKWIYGQNSNHVRVTEAKYDQFGNGLSGTEVFEELINAKYKERIKIL